MTGAAVTAENYRYYRSSVAAGDGIQGGEPAVSSSEPGVPAGVWAGGPRPRWG
ncbi:hypothetical protein ACFQ60_02295 [Streptomyces zhihengii]